MVTIWQNVDKPTTTLGGWSFNEIALSFNEAIEEETGGIVYFNGVGTGQTWSNDTKHSSSFSNTIKNTSIFTNLNKN